MHIAYFDESGDDGYPNTSSELFVLSALYFHYQAWQSLFCRVRDLRRDLKQRVGLPIRTEIHTRSFLLNKKPYRKLQISDTNRISVIDDCCNLIAELDLKAINVVIVKPRIKNPNYAVLDTAVKYSIQRIENDLDPNNNPDTKFMIIADRGRVQLMRKTTRKIQRFNPVPSIFGPYSQRREIQTLIEDPLEKDSKQSYFIQLADLVTSVVYLYGAELVGGVPIHRRLRELASKEKVLEWLDTLKPSLNLQAAHDDPYGVVFHPR